MSSSSTDDKTENGSNTSAVVDTDKTEAEAVDNKESTEKEENDDFAGGESSSKRKRDETDLNGDSTNVDDDTSKKQRSTDDHNDDKPEESTKTANGESTEVSSSSSSDAVAAPAVGTVTITTPGGLSITVTTAENGMQTMIMKVTPDKVGQIIGSRGAIIQDIQMRSGAKAYVNQDFPPNVHREVNITGLAEQCEKAKDLIIKVVEEGPQAIHVNSMTGGPVTTSVVECTQQQVGKVIGTGGSVIKDIQSKSGAKIQIEQDFPPEVPRKINITGSSQAVTLAIQLVNTVMTTQSGPPAGTSMGSYGTGASAISSYGMQMSPGIGIPSAVVVGVGGESKQTIDVPRAAVGKIIGKGGETIQTIQKKSGARVTVNQEVPDGSPCHVLMTGNPQSLSVATALIQEILAGIQQGNMGGGMMMGGRGMMNPYGMMQGMNAYGYNNSGGGGMGSYGQYGYQQQGSQGGTGGYNMAAGAYGSYGPSAGSSSSNSGSVGGYGQSSMVASSGTTQSVWTEHKTDDGIPYWFNSATGVSQVMQKIVKIIIILYLFIQNEKLYHTLQWEPPN